MKFYSKSLIFLAFFFFIVTSCQKNDAETPQPDDNWQLTGLEDLHVSKIKLAENHIYAATYNGIYRKTNTNSTNDWQNVGLEAKEVLDFIVFNEQEILAAVQLNPEEETSLYRTTDGGNSWLPFQQGFGGEETTTVRSLGSDPANPDIIFARGDFVVARSTDRGQSWELVFGEDWDMAGYQAPLIEVNPNFPDFVWAGGENTIFQPYLLKSTDRGTTWTRLELPYEGDNAVYTLVSHADNPEHILIGMEGQILSSLYGGDQWVTSMAIEDGTYIISMVNHPNQSETVFGSGSQGGTSGGNLFFYESTDFGQSWELHENDAATGIYFINDLAVQIQEEELVLYFATNQGVYTFSRR